jgi:hypothetical protein
MDSQTVLTLGQVAKRLGVQVWQVGKIYERRLLPEPRRAGILRIVAEDDLPAIEAALRKANYLPAGDNRLALAERFGEVPMIACRYIDAKNAAVARAIGTTINVQDDLELQ